MNYNTHSNIIEAIKRAETINARGEAFLNCPASNQE